MTASALGPRWTSGSVVRAAGRRRRAWGAIHPRTDRWRRPRGDRYSGRYGHDVLLRPVGRSAWDGRTLAAAHDRGDRARVLAMVGTPTSFLITGAPSSRQERMFALASLAVVFVEVAASVCWVWVAVGFRANCLRARDCGGLQPVEGWSPMGGTGAGQGPVRGRRSSWRGG